MVPLSGMPALLACPLCRAAIPDGVCPRCGDYPCIGGVRIALPRPAAAIAALRQSLVTTWVESQVAAAATTNRDGLSAHERATEAHAVLGMANNQELLSAIVTPALAAAIQGDAPSPSRDLATLLACDNVWPFADTLPYFYADWCAPAGDARARLLADVAQHRPPSAREQTALVLGSAGGLLVDDLAALLGSAWGVDRSIAPLLLSRRLLDGETFTAHLQWASWQPCVLRGATRTTPHTNLVAGDAAALPFADGSFEVVVSQYLLDIVRDPAGVLTEIHRVLAPGGIWVNLGLPFRFCDQPSWAPRGTDAAWRAFAPRFGFDVIDATRHPVEHRGLVELDAWSTSELQQAVRAVLRKVASVPEAPTRAALRAYFAGDDGPLSTVAPTLREPVEVRSRRGRGGKVEQRAIRLGEAILPMPNEDALAQALAFLDALDGSTPVPSIVRATQAEPRDVALALEGLARAGYLALH
jgi:SAM-dependent methyltransferase